MMGMRRQGGLEGKRSEEWSGEDGGEGKRREV
jgi:hypothetical protein